jgi:Ca2+-transporting ATPase
MAENLKGLSETEVKKRLGKFGKNELPEKPPPSELSILIDQFKSPLVYILLVAGVITLALQEFSDAGVIFFAVLLNTVLGFIQESRASHALEALKKLIHPEAAVIRDGEIIKIDASEIVPGDIAILHQGEKIPADGKLVEANKFYANEAILTGESVPVEKKVGESVYMGTIVNAGSAKMKVELTGEETEIGKIAISVQEIDEDTPLRRQLKDFSKSLSYIVLGLTTFVFVVGIITGKGIIEIFITSVALAVSSIPEGLLVGLTAVLAIGMQRILSRRGLVRKLVSAETLGGVTVICADKTGTLTEGEMQVVNYKGNEKDLFKQAIIANDLDDPIVLAAYDWAEKGYGKKQTKKLLKKSTRLDTIPFSSKERFFASLNKGKDKNMIFVNGAPEFLLEWTNLKDSDKKKIKEDIEDFTKKGMRLMGFARKQVGKEKKKIGSKDIKGGLDWTGILAFNDPVRDGVKEALEKTKKAGIKLIVITGDYSKTAVSVMERLGIEVNEDEVLTGDDLRKLDRNELSQKLKKGDTVLFARTTPDQKLKIVESLKENGEVVAMTGDGVNDAPALNKADIGVVVGEATDVAKETAELVLLDSSFATVVAAVEEGRGIFDNIRKIILYLMSDAFEEIVAVVLTIVFKLPLPVTAAQILWINILSDGFPHLALTVDPKEPGIMQKPPRDPKEKLVSGWMKKLIMIVSIEGGLVAFALFTYFLKTTGDIHQAQSVAFATLGVNSLVYVFSVRTLTDPFWKENPLDNKWLNLAVSFGFVFQIAPFLFEPARKFLEIKQLTFGEWALVFAASILMFMVIEVSKYVFRRHLDEGK